MKKVTLVIPVYNSEKYLKKCIDSVLSQTANNYKLLLINDGSTDNSQKIIDEYCNKYPDIIESISQKNKGVSKTRNFAIDYVKTEYIMFMDNDDYIDRDYIETLFNAIDEDKSDIALSGFRRPNENNVVLNETRLSQNEWSKMMIMTPWAKIFRTKFLQDKKIYFLENNIGEDIFLNIIAVFETNKIKILDYIGYNWFYNSESVSNSSQKDISKINVDKLLNSCYDELNKRNLIKDNYEMIEAHFIRYLYWFILYSTKDLKYKELKREYKRLFKWLKDRFPKYRKNKIIGINKPKGDVSSNKRIFTLFYVSHKFRMGPLFVFTYNKYRILRHKV